MANKEVEVMCSPCPFYKEGENCHPWIPPFERERIAHLKYCISSGVLDDEGKIILAERYKSLFWWKTKIIKK